MSAGRSTHVKIEKHNGIWLGTDWTGVNIAVIPPRRNGQPNKNRMTWWIYDGEDNWPLEVHAAVQELTALW